MKEALDLVVRKILAQAAHCGVDELFPERRLRDLEIDSVGSRAVSVVLEAELDIVLDAEAFNDVFATGTVDTLIDRLTAIVGWTSGQMSEHVS